MLLRSQPLSEELSKKLEAKSKSEIDAMNEDNIKSQHIGHFAAGQHQASGQDARTANNTKSSEIRKEKRFYRSRPLQACGVL